MLLLFWFLLFCFSSTNDTFKYLQLLYIKIVFLVFYFWFFGFSFIFIICHFVTFFYIRSHPHTEPIGCPNQKSMSHFSLNRKTICYSPIYFLSLLFLFILNLFSSFHYDFDLVLYFDSYAFAFYCFYFYVYVKFLLIYV